MKYYVGKGTLSDGKINLDINRGFVTKRKLKRGSLGEKNEALKAQQKKYVKY